MYKIVIAVFQLARWIARLTFKNALLQPIYLLFATIYFVTSWTIIVNLVNYGYLVYALVSTLNTIVSSLQFVHSALLYLDKRFYNKKVSEDALAEVNSGSGIMPLFSVPSDQNLIHRSLNISSSNFGDRPDIVIDVSSSATTDMSDSSEKYPFEEDYFENALGDAVYTESRIALRL